MATMDIFEGSAFSTRELSAAIDQIPNQWGRITALGLFRNTPVRTPNIAIESRDGVLSLIGSSPRGTDPAGGRSSSRKLRNFTTARFAQQRTVTADEIDGIRAFGSETELRQVGQVVTEKLADLRSDIDITREYLQAGALAGVVNDADGNALVNLFTEFAVSQKVVDFVLGTSTTDVAAKVREVRRHIEVNLLGDTMTRVHALCSPTFMDALLGHPKIEAAYQFYMNTNPLREDVARQFTYMGVTFEEYLGEAPTPNDAGGETVRKFIADGDARFFPVGTQRTFRGFNAPADWMETVNTPGRPVYAKQWGDDAGRMRTIEGQTNYLPICMRPAVLVRGHSSN
ncbi:MAG: major capsid protein [Haliangiales bacterium]